MKYRDYKMSPSSVHLLALIGAVPNHPQSRGIAKKLPVLDRHLGFLFLGDKRREVKASLKLQMAKNFSEEAWTWVADAFKHLYPFVLARKKESEQLYAQARS